MVLTVALALQVLVSVAFLTVGWIVVCLVNVAACRVSFVLLTAVFSPRALGAGFRPGVRPMVSTTFTMDWTGRRFVAAIL